MWVQNHLCSLKGRTVLRLGVKTVFVNQMLLMIAGDVEPNPGPGKGNRLWSRERKGKKGWGGWKPYLTVYRMGYIMY